MELRAKSVRAVAGPEDGERLLVMAFRPRDMSEGAADRWERRLAPSQKLLFAYRNGWVTWREFAGLYVAEMWSQAPLLRDLGEQATLRPVTLLCQCQDERRCHRSLLRRIVERMFRVDARARFAAVALR